MLRLRAAAFGFDAQFSFQFGHPFEQIRKMPDGDELPFHFLVRLRGLTEPFPAVGYVVHHPGLRRHNHLIADF